MKRKRKLRIIDGAIISNSALIPEDLEGSEGSISEDNGNEHIPTQDLYVSQELDISELEEIDLSLYTEKPEDKKEDTASFKRPPIEKIDPADFKIIEGIMIPADQVYIPESHRPGLPIPTNGNFAPYLIKNNASDFSGYLHFLEATGKTRRTRSEYGIDLRRWGRELEGEVSIAKINAIVKRFDTENKPYRAIRMRNILKSYATYRNFHGDSKLLIMLTTSLSLYNPVIPKKKREKPTDNLSEKEKDIYWDLAKDLVKDRKREGIWIGLLLLGISPAGIQEAEFANKSTLRYQLWGKEKEARIEKWLYDACQSIPEESWRLGRRTIHKEVAKYEVSPRALNNFARSRK